MLKNYQELKNKIKLNISKLIFFFKKINLISFKNNMRAETCIKKTKM